MTAGKWFIQDINTYKEVENSEDEDSEDEDSESHFDESIPDHRDQADECLHTSCILIVP